MARVVNSAWRITPTTSFVIISGCRNMTGKRVKNSCLYKKKSFPVKKNEGDQDMLKQLEA